MKNANIIQQKTFNFALKSIEFYKMLIKESKEFVISRQFLKSSTSIGANIEEAIGAQSNADFISKINIAYKEARETRYWLKVIINSGINNGNEAESLINDLEEIIRIIGKILVTLKKNH